MLPQGHQLSVQLNQARATLKVKARLKDLPRLEMLQEFERPTHRELSVYRLPKPALLPDKLPD
jgi:hypothetical protein